MQAQQVAVTKTPTPYSSTQVRPGQIPVSAAPTAATSAMDFSTITTMITAIMPLIMLVLMFQMLKPLLSGMAAS